MRNINNEFDEYFEGFSGVVLDRLIILRDLVDELIPEASKAIKYGIPTYVYKGNLIHFAGYKNHIGLYPTPSGIEEFESELKKYKQGKGSIQFPNSQDFPVDLITRIIKFRIKEQSEKL